MKAKTRIYRDEVNTNFQGKRGPKENASYKCISVTILDSAVEVTNMYYPETLLQEYESEKKRINHLMNMKLNPINLIMLAAKRFLALLRGITNHNGDFYNINCLHSFRTEK